MRLDGWSSPHPIAIVILAGLVGLGLYLYGHDGLPLAATGHEQALYAADDPWRDYLANERQCPGGEDRSASVSAQKLTVLCLLNWARSRDGLQPLPTTDVLSRSALLKAEDIIRCGDFAHAACGKAPGAVATQVGFAGSAWGENLYLGPAGFGRPRIAVDQWLNSPEHRENLFRAQWTQQGVALLAVPEFGGQADVAIWVSQFGVNP